MNSTQSNSVLETQPGVENAEAPRIPEPALRIPELLAPAGDWDCARAAVENGADAIYFGLEKFNARMRARNFTEADLPKLMEFLHRRGVKGYVTFNTLVFADEMAGAEQCLRAIISAGLDAAIVQDIGICRLIRSLSPDFPIHASTQMTVTSAAGVEFARELGCNLVVLARECSIAEIEKIQAAQQASIGAGASTSLPLEETEPGPQTQYFRSSDIYDLQMGFSRGLHTGWFRGINHQELVHARFGKKRGVYLGKVTQIRRDQILFSAEAPVKAGDGVV